MKHEVAKLDGALLDAAVAMLEGYSGFVTAQGEIVGKDGIPTRYNYSGSWGMAGRIIEREHISVSNPNGDPGWIGTKAFPAKPKRDGTPQWRHVWLCGRTPLVAAMRCYVASKCGDEVELPEPVSSLQSP